MPELNKGFIPFDTYNAGNDYNPYGYNTSKAMKWINVSAYTDYSGYNVITTAVNTRKNTDGYTAGIWHNVRVDHDEPGYINPVIKITSNLVKNVIAVSKGSTKNVNIKVEVSAGTSELKSSILYLNNEILIEKTDDTSFNIDYTISLNEAKTYTFKAITTDKLGNSSMATYAIYVENLIYYGVVNTTNPDSSTIKSLHKSIKSDIETEITLIHNASYNYICIAYDKKFGKLIDIYYETVSYIDDFIRSEIKIDNVDFYVYVMNVRNTDPEAKLVYKFKG